MSQSQTGRTSNQSHPMSLLHTVPLIYLEANDVMRVEVATRNHQLIKCHLSSIKVVNRVMITLIKMMYLLRIQSKSI